MTESNRYRLIFPEADVRRIYHYDEQHSLLRRSNKNLLINLAASVLISVLLVTGIVIGNGIMAGAVILLPMMAYSAWRHFSVNRLLRKSIRSADTYFGKYAGNPELFIELRDDTLLYSENGKESSINPSEIKTCYFEDDYIYLLIGSENFLLPESAFEEKGYRRTIAWLENQLPPEKKEYRKLRKH